MFSLSYVYTGHISQATASVPISITDPPIVPSGTQSLYINYTSVSVRTSYGGKTGWTQLNLSGRLELMSLINVSQVIGDANLTSNSTLDQVEFNISSASITVDNVTYPVTVAKKQIAATIINGERVNGTSGVLLDFSPVVTPEYIQNTTKFIMDPSLKAAMVQGLGFGGQGEQGPNQQHPLEQKYADLFKGNDANLTITDANLTSGENYSTLKVILTNYGNSSVTVMGAMLMGDVNPYFAPNAPAPGGLGQDAFPANATGFNCSQIMNWPMGSKEQRGALPENSTEANGPMGPGNFGTARQPDSAGAINASDATGPSMRESEKPADSGFWARGGRAFEQTNSSVTINASALVAIGKACGVDRIGIMLPATANVIQISGIENASDWANFYDGPGARFAFMHPVGVSFAVEDNGTLSMQLPWEAMNRVMQEGGYVLAPGATVTLEYTGKLVVGGMKAMGGLLQQNDSSYTITVLTDNGIAQANFTSS